MCVRPVYLPQEIYDDPDGRGVPCRKCWACRRNRIYDWVGRCLGETVTSSDYTILTLTYAGDVPGSVLLLYSDVQRMLWLLRRHGFSCRYIVSGEHGTRWGRAHWHIAIFWQGLSPPLPNLNEFGQWRYWPHGHVHNRKADSAGLAYILKYMQKDISLDNSVVRFAMSKKPPLGLPYFKRIADEMVERRIMPQSFDYSFPGVVDRKGRLRQFQLRGRMRELYLDRFAVSWRLRWSEQPPPNAFISEKHLDSIAKGEMDDQDFAARFGEPKIEDRPAFGDGLPSPDFGSDFEGIPSGAGIFGGYRLSDYPTPPPPGF